jgi:hypothetical protein
VPQVEIVAGFVSDVPPQARYSFTFSIGIPPKTVSMNSLGEPPFESNEYIAVAIRQSRLSTWQYTALAYRRLGLAAPAHIVSPLFPGSSILIGLMGLVNLARFRSLDAQFVMLSVVAIGVGVVGALTLRSTLLARRTLAAWQPPDSLTDVGEVREN